MDTSKIVIPATPKKQRVLVVIKPNSYHNIMYRTLRNLANRGLDIVDIRLTQLSTDDTALLWKHEWGLAENCRVTLEQYATALEDKLVTMLVVQGEDAVFVVKDVLGDVDPRYANKNSLRNQYGSNRVENAFFNSDNAIESHEEIEHFFPGLEIDAEGVVERPCPVIDINMAKSFEKLPSQTIALGMPEITLVVLAPTLVVGTDWVYAIEDLSNAAGNVKQKLTLVNLLKTQLDERAMNLLFEGHWHFWNKEVMTKEFSRGDALLLLLEGEDAINQVQERIGRFRIAVGNDFERTRKKAGAGGFGYAKTDLKLMQEYGAYLFSFANQKAIAEKAGRFFDRLYNAKSHVCT